MKKILFIIVMLTLCAVQFTSAQTVGYLTTVDSTINVLANNNQWVYFFLIDSTGSGDTAYVEKYNEYAGTWNPILAKDDSSGTLSPQIIMPVNNQGKSFTVWKLYPGTIRLRRTNRAAIADKLYYYIFTR